MRLETVELAHFEELYARGPDPWRFATSAYEAAKYAASLAALPRARYARALDVGCSIGVFTAALAERCDDVLAVEPVAAALEQARQRCGSQPWVRFAEMFVPGQWPEGRFDLVVISEVLDYLGSDDVARLADRLEAAVEPGGDLLLVHWVAKKKKTGNPGSAEATDVLAGILSPEWVICRAERNADYRLDLLQRL